MKGPVAILVILLGAGAAFTANAQPSTDDIIKRLKPNETILPKPGLRDLPWTKKDRGIVEEGEEKLPSIDLHISFEYNSDRLSPDAILTLRRLGAALKDAHLAGYRFKIAGHTDAKGTAAYNQKLSERRAIAVRDYLIFQYDIEGGRLETVGHGFKHLADPQRPQDGINRRVQVINIGSDK